MLLVANFHNAAPWAGQLFSHQGLKSILKKIITTFPNLLTLVSPTQAFPLRKLLSSLLWHCYFLCSFYKLKLALVLFCCQVASSFCFLFGATTELSLPGLAWRIEYWLFPTPTPHSPPKLSSWERKVSAANRQKQIRPPPPPFFFVTPPVPERVASNKT